MDNRRGILLMVLAMAAFAVEDAFIKVAAVALPAGQIIALLGAAGIPFYAALLRRNGLRLWSRDALHTASLLRLAGEIVATICFVTALAAVPLAVASAILQALPLAITAAAALLLAEPVGWRRWSAVTVGFAGVLIIVRPGGEGFMPASLLVVVAVLALVLRDLMSGRVPRRISSLQLSAWVYVALAPTGVALSLAAGTPWAWPGPGVAAALGGAMVFGIVAYWAVTETMRVGEVSVVAPFRYTRLVFSLVIAVMFLGERPDGWTLAGAAIIILTGLYTLSRERMLRRRPARPTGSPVRTDLRT